MLWEEKRVMDNSTLASKPSLLIVLSNSKCSFLTDAEKSK